MKNLPRLLLALICTLFATTAPAQTPEQARNFQIDSTHKGSITTEHLSPPLKHRWTVNFGRPTSYPLIADGKVFVTVKNAALSSGTTLFALNATNGATIWSFNLGGISSWGAACYENGRVFAINNAGLLRSFDGATGSLNWSVQLPGQSSFSAPPSVHNGVIYTSGSGAGGTLYAVNADSGTILWTKAVENGVMSSPAVTNDGVYVSYSCPNVYKFNPVTGVQIWRSSTGCSGGGGKTAALYNGRLYVRDFFDTIFDSDTGTIVGNFNAKNTPAFSGARGFFLDGPHGFGSFGTLLARDINTNSILWTFSGDGFLQSAVLAVNNHVYVGSSQGNLYAVDAATGQQAWVINTGESIPYVDEQNLSQPLTSFAAAEGILVVPTSTKLIAYDSDTTPPTLTFGNPTPAPNAAGWNNTAVDIPFTTADDFSGIQSSNPASPLHFVSEGANQTQQVTVTDNAGNSATFTSPAVNIDFTGPVVTTSANPATAPKGPKTVTVTISGSITDNLSGLASASFNVIDEYGAAQPSGSVTVQANGTYSFTLSLPATKQGWDKDGHLYTIVVRGTDRAGNSTTATTTLRIT